MSTRDELAREGLHPITESIDAGQQADDEQFARTRAHAEIAQLLEYDEQYTHDSDGTKWFDYESGADRIVDDFDRIAGLLGYVKADSEEWGYRRYPGYATTQAPSRFAAELGAECTTEGTVMRRTVGCGPWEVA